MSTHGSTNGTIAAPPGHRSTPVARGPARHLRLIVRVALAAAVALVIGLIQPLAAQAASVPGVPANVTATATGSNTIHVAWSGVSGATSYVVSDGDSSSASLSSTSYNWTGLTPGKYTCFTVTAKNSAGQSAWSSYACATTTVPAPTNVVVSAKGPNVLHISWTDNTAGKATYVVSNGNVTQGPYQAGTTGVDWNVGVAGKYMCFTVAANEGTGQSPWTAYVCGTTAVLQPTNVAAVVTSAGTVHISWTDNSGGQATYTVSNGDVSIPNDLPTGSTSYNWAAFAPNTYMCFTVAAKENSGQSPWSAYACVTTPSTAGDSYVNLGDSFSAGEGTYSPYLAGTDTSTDKCHRSPNSYSGQYAAMSTYFHAVTNVACSGAVTEDIANPPGATNSMGIPSAGEPAQLSGLNSSTSLVTATIGGNNLNLGGIFSTCYAKIVIPLIDDCFASSFSDSFIASIPTLLGEATNYGPSLDTTYQDIRDAAPNAQIVVLTYPQTYPTVSPGYCGTIPETMIGQGSLDRIRRVVSAINGAVRAAAAAHGFGLLDEENAFAGHEECTADPWVNPVNNFGNDDESLHPNVAGYAREAANLKTYLGG